MSSLFSKALVYLGLVDEDQVADPDNDTGPARATEAPAREPAGSRVRAVQPLTPVQGRRVEPPSATTRTHSQARVDQSSGVRPVRPAEAQSDVLVVEEFGDAKILADRVRDRVPVVLDLRLASPELVRRVIDFSSGLIYALDGKMKKVGEGLVLVLPPRTTLSRDEKRRLADLGVYQLDVDA